MQASDRAEFKRLLTDAMAFYRRDVSKFALDVWWAACSPFDIEQVGKAFTAHAMDPERGQFPPMPADIVRQLSGTYTDRSLVAWGKVYESIGRVGAYQSVAFDDPAIHAALADLGGWTVVCRTPESELPHLQRRFTEAHRVYTRRKSFAYPQYLVGASEAENAAKGYRRPHPVLVGDADVARAVMAGGAEGSRVVITLVHSAVPRLERPAA